MGTLWSMKKNQRFDLSVDHFRHSKDSVLHHDKICHLMYPLSCLQLLGKSLSSYAPLPSCSQSSGKGLSSYVSPVMLTVIGKRSLSHLMYPLSCLRSSGKRSVLLCIPCHVYSHQEKVCHLMHPLSCLELLGNIYI